MQEEISQKVIAFSTKGAKLTEEILKQALRAALRKIQNEYNTPKVGRNSLKRLTGKQSDANMIEVSGRLREFERYAKQYNVRYSIRKDPTSTPTRWQVFFKANQADAITAAFAKYTQTLTKKQDKPSLLGALRKNMEKLRANSPDKDKEKNLSMGGLAR